MAFDPVSAVLEIGVTGYNHSMVSCRACGEEKPESAFRISMKQDAKISELLIFASQVLKRHGS